MKNLAFVFAFTLFVGTFATPAYAAMPNFIGTGYKQAVDCTVDDRGVWELVGNKFTMTGCITGEAHERAEAAARANQNTMYKFGPMQSVVLKTGQTETCPFWFFMGCVIDRALIK